MKKYTLVLSVLAFVWIPNWLSAQNYYPKELDEWRFYNRIESAINKLDAKQYDGIEGTPYLFPDFKDAQVLTFDSILYHGKLRYDMYADQMEYKVANNTYWLANPEVIKYIKMDGTKFIFYPEKMGKNKGTYYQMLVDGTCKLLIRKSVLYKDPEPAKPYQDAKPAKFVPRKDVYYLLKNGSQIQKAGNKKTTLTYLNDHTKELASFIKQNRISFSKGSDLAKLVTFYNTLE